MISSRAVPHGNQHLHGTRRRNKLEQSGVKF
jgi:hypothetical protein